MKTLTIAKPDDWHIHLRDGNALPRTVNDVAGWAQRAIVMPNLVPPVLDAAAAMAYRQRILAARQPQHQHFEPLMILYLSDKTTIEDVTEAAESPHIHGIKLYPAGATTNSEAGVNDLTYLYPVFEAMEKHNLPLLIHGEVTDSDIDIFDREKIFIDRYLSKLVTDFPGLRVVFEHITTTNAVEFVAEARDGVAATVTAHHLLYNRNDLLVGGVRPHYFCLPILKRNSHQESLRKAVISGNPRFFLGTDSAPHAKAAKESACGCAGCYTAHAAIELYAEVFEAEGALPLLEGFASHFGADFYDLPRNTETITLVKESQTVPDTVTMGDETLIPLRAGELLNWRIRQ